MDGDLPNVRCMFGKCLDYSQGSLSSRCSVLPHLVDAVSSNFVSTKLLFAHATARFRAVARMIREMVHHSQLHIGPSILRKRMSLGNEGTEASYSDCAMACSPHSN